jgi:hypothetical protein
LLTVHRSDLDVPTVLAEQTRRRIGWKPTASR